MIIAITNGEDMRKYPTMEDNLPPFACRDGVTQTQFGKSGNCLEACIATILKTDIYDVPVLYPHRQVDYESLYRWLADKEYIMFIIGFIPREMPVFFRLKTSDRFASNNIFIANGHSEAGTRHSVVGYKNEIIWDPSPAGKGLASVDSIMMLYKRVGPFSNVPGNIAAHLNSDEFETWYNLCTFGEEE